jgi:ubiquinone/menaquinone biosynthesis C-methylase UbiE
MDPMTQPGFDADAFRDFERAAHGARAESYHDRFAAVTGRAIAPLLDAVQASDGTPLLDVASGPGHLAGAAARRGARVTGVDLAPAMIELARRLYPGVTFREGSAEQLPFADASFEAVTCAFGVGHFPDSPRVLRDIARVLAPGGRAALAWWDGFERNRINGVFYDVMMRLKVSAPGVVPVGPPIDQYSDRERFAQLLRDAGLSDVRVDAVSFRHPLKDADALWSTAMGSFARASSVIAAQSDDRQREIRAAVTQAAAPYATSDGLAIPVAFLVASGVRA